MIMIFMIMIMIMIIIIIIIIMNWEQRQNPSININKLMSGFCLTTVHRQGVLVKALIIVDCELAPPQLSQVGWHVTSADTCCVTISRYQQQTWTWPLHATAEHLVPVPRPRTQADPAGPTPDLSDAENGTASYCIHDSIHEPTIEPTWTHLNLHCLHLQHLQLHCVWDLSTNRFIVCDHTPCRSAVPSILDSVPSALLRSGRSLKTSKSRSKAVQSHLFPRHGIVFYSFALHFNLAQLTLCCSERGQTSWRACPWQI